VGTIAVLSRDGREAGNLIITLTDPVSRWKP